MSKKISIKSMLEKYGFTDIKFKTKLVEANWRLNNTDKQAAWEMYVELITRIATQPLNDEHGDELTALNSVYQIFPITRDILKHKGRQCHEFSKVAIVVLNQVIRPFTAKWHKESLNGAFGDSKKCKMFRKELKDIQERIFNYTKLLADLAEVEDMTEVVN